MPAFWAAIATPLYMEQIGDMKFVDFEEILERDLGKIGTPKRDEFERKVDESVKKVGVKVGVTP